MTYTNEPRTKCEWARDLTILALFVCALLALIQEIDTWLTSMP